jgi:cytoskeleton protein RodZ
MSIGTELANARRQAGLTVAQVSQRTRIRPVIIEGIERDDFSLCGGDFYARGHIRAIARAAGIDPEPLVAEYDEAREAVTQESIPVGRGGRPGQVPGATGTPARAAGTAVTSGPGTAPGWPGRGIQPQPGARGRGGWILVLLVLLAVAAGVIIYHVVSSPNVSAPTAGGTPAASKAAATPTVSASPTARPTPTPTASPTPTPDNLVISLAASTEPCWAQLTTSNGTTIYEGIVAAGNTMTWTESQPVTLTLGNPGFVTLTVNGKPETGLGINPVTLNLAPGQPGTVAGTG